ncbi:MAG TPA: hypothetical protein VN832_13230 [Stellaceae bacterium]|nr:hypothetical protein [Stellaceae bacterium]
MTDSIPGGGALRALRRTGIAALAIALAASALVVSPAFAQPRRDRGHDRGYYDEHHRWRPPPPPVYGYGYAAPPPPVVYAPPPVSPGINFIIPLHFR